MALCWLRSNLPSAPALVPVGRTTTFGKAMRDSVRFRGTEPIVQGHKSYIHPTCTRFRIIRRSFILMDGPGWTRHVYIGQATSTEWTAHLSDGDSQGEVTFAADLGLTGLNVGGFHVVSQRSANRRQKYKKKQRGCSVF